MFILSLGIALLSVPARAAWWVQDSVTLGSRSFVSNTFTALVQDRRGRLVEASHGFYTDETLPGEVHSFGTRLSLAREKRIYSVKGVWYPERFGSSSAGGAVNVGFLVNREEEAHTQALLGISAVGHRTPLAFKDGSSGRRDTLQMGFDASIQQTYFRLFQLSIGGSVFLYDRPFEPVDSSAPLYDAGRLNWLLASRPVTPFPRAVGSIQFSRRSDLEARTYFFIGYSRFRFAGDAGKADSVLTGLDFQVTPNLRIDAAFNWWDPKGAATEHYFSVLVRLSS